MINKIWKTRKERQKLGFMIPPLWLCECGCNEIVYGGKIFKHNHHCIGKNNCNFGKPMSEEQKIKLRKPRTEKTKKLLKDVWTPERKEKISKISSEFMNKPENIKRMSKHMSKINATYGKNYKYRENIRQQKIKFMNLPEQKERVSKQLIKLWDDPKFKEKMSGKNHPLYGHPPNHSQRIYPHQTPLQGIILMHRWEHLYAEYLDSVNELYLYEPDFFEMNINGKETTYTPDFLLPLQNKFIEIKGYWRDDAKLKSNNFKEQYKDTFNYEVLFGKDLKNLGIKIGKS